MILFTIGFAEKSAEEFFGLLTQNQVKRLLDIRLNNKSQLAGFTNIKHLPYFLKLHGMEYHYLKEYAPTKELLDGYKGGTIPWERYEKTYLKLLKERDVLAGVDWGLLSHAVLLCSEPTPEHCHRRLLAEYLAKNGKNLTVRHLG